MIATGIGIGFAFVAMLCWGFGDFMIQRSSRKIGDWETLFVITLFGAVILLPFCWDTLVSSTALAGAAGFLLVACGLLYFIGSLLDFESLRIGKITVVEPIWSFEIIVSAIMAFFVLGERLSAEQIALIAILIAALILVSVKDWHVFRSHKILLEKGTLMALAAALTMGIVNFFIGWGSRMTDPILVNFIINSIVALGCGIYLVRNGKMGKLGRDIKENPKMLVPMMISDNVAWVAFAFSMSLAPIGVAVALSESYIIVAVLLGFFVSRERIRAHQKLGLAAAIIAAVTLASVTRGF